MFWTDIESLFSIKNMQVLGFKDNPRHILKLNFSLEIYLYNWDDLYD